MADTQAAQGEVRTCSWCPHKKKTRSVSHHNFLFACIAAAFDNWPPDHPFKPDNPEHLRAWLLVEIGHRDTLEINLTEFASAKTIAEKATIAALAAIKRNMPKQTYQRMYRTDAGLMLCTPKSISRAELKADDYTKVCDRVIGEISHILGIPADMLRSEGKKRMRGTP